MNHMSLPIKMTIFVSAALLFLLRITPGQAAEGVQKLRVAYAAITAAFSIPWIAKEAGIFQRHAAFPPVGKELRCRQALQNGLRPLLRQAAEPCAVADRRIQVHDFLTRFLHSVVVVA